MNFAFSRAELQEFHRCFKRECMAYLYGNAKAKELYEDFFWAYCGGHAL